MRSSPPPAAAGALLRAEPGGEDDLVAWLRRRLGRPSAGLIGDDAAFLEARGDLAWTVDSQIDGVHVPPGLPDAVVARRLLAVNLSDLAAVGAEPAWALLSLAAPAEADRRPFLAALGAACREHGVVLAGGDLSRSEQRVATLTLLGRRPPRGRWLRRDLARPGDVLWLGGTVGESALGRLLLAAGAGWRGGRPATPPRLPRELAAAARRAVARHLAPRPQLALGRALGRRRRCAALDLSDGLARDLHRLLAASGVGARVERSELPLSRDAARLAAWVGADPEEQALGGGEDYVLLFALPAGQAPPAGGECRRIGAVVAARGAVLVGPDGSEEDLPPRGWDHLTPRRAEPS